jgi:hypothetical protein
MVGHLTLTALEIQRDQTAGGAAATHLIFSLDGERSVWQNNPSHGDNAATARSTETYRLRKIAGESEVSRSETFVSWVLKRCGYTNTPATIYFNMDYEELCKAFREEVKTKHAKKKAQKKAEVKRTRAVKKDAQVTKECLRKDILNKIEYQIKFVRERNAASNENVAFINKVFAKVRQAISE